MNRGFTLIELIVVVSVIAILAGIITPVAGVLIEQARSTRAIAEVDTLGKACLLYESKNGYQPYSGMPGGSAAYSYSYDASAQTQLNNLLQGFIAGRVMYDPWGANTYKYHHYDPWPTANVVACHFGKDKGNNGVWDGNLWMQNRAYPGDDYYKIFK
jgi:prepilin-type N-terminal cleavage/methylation domain-containing protein